jgi:hypothetical protein
MNKTPAQLLAMIEAARPAAVGVTLALSFCFDAGFSFVIEGSTGVQVLAAEHTSQERLDAHLAGFVANVNAAAAKAATIDGAVRLVTAFHSFADLQDTAATYYPKFYGRAQTKAELIARAIVVEAFNEWAAKVGRLAIAFDKEAPARVDMRQARDVQQVMRAGACSFSTAVDYLVAEEWNPADALHSLRGDRAARLAPVALLAS